MKRSFSFSIAMIIGLTLVILLGCAKNKNDELRQLAQKYVNIWNEKDIDALVELYDEDATMIMPGEAEPLKGKDAIRANQNAYFIAFPDMHVEIGTILTSETEFCIEMITKGTNTGPLATPQGEIPPTGRQMSLQAAFLAKVSPAGLIIEDRTYFDSMVLLTQLGLTE